MKRCVILILMVVCSFCLSACFYSQQPSMKQFSQEKWIGKVGNKVDTRDASPWFFRDESKDQENVLTDSINFVTVPVYDFSSIQIAGNFDVQIKGNVKQNYVMVQGPPNVTKFIKIRTIAQTLQLQQLVSSPALDKVIIRIGIKSLNSLFYQGAGSVEATQLRSPGLIIKSIGSGDIYLKGNYFVRQILQEGNGLISMMGARANQLDILAKGEGEIGISGLIGLHSIVTHRSSEVNIIGAQGENLAIVADNHSKIAIRGQVNISTIRLKDRASVYINAVNSHYLQIHARDHSRVGLRGKVNNLSVELNGGANFYGRDLLARHAFVRTNGQTHANVTATAKLYANANNNSSIYFFGPNDVLFSAANDEAIILPIANYPSNEPVSTMKPFFMQ